MTKDELQKINSKEILLVDIRTADEVRATPLPLKTVHIPMREVIEKVNNGLLPKDKKIVTICHSGGRCMMLHQFLVENGYEADYLEGGIMSL